MNDPFGFATNVVEEAKMTFSNITKATDAPILGDRHEIERRYGLEIPFHVREDHEIGARDQNFFLL